MSHSSNHRCFLSRRLTRRIPSSSSSSLSIISADTIGILSGERKEIICFLSFVALTCHRPDSFPPLRDKTRRDETRRNSSEKNNKETSSNSSACLVVWTNDDSFVEIDENRPVTFVCHGNFERKRFSVDAHRPIEDGVLGDVVRS